MRNESPYSDQTYASGRVGSSRKEREMFSLLAILVALVCFSASVAMIYADDADCVYPPRFE
jgi:hypothetical protein